MKEADVVNSLRHLVDAVTRKGPLLLEQLMRGQADTMACMASVMATMSNNWRNITSMTQVTAPPPSDSPPSSHPLIVHLPSTLLLSTPSTL
jgi:hypothetical protein